MQLTEKHLEYWHKNLTITGDPAVHLVPGDVRHGLLRPRAFVQFLRLDLRVLHGRAGLVGHLRDHHLVLRALHEQASIANSTCMKGRTNNGRHSSSQPGRGAFSPRARTRKFKSQLQKVYTWYTGGFIAFVILLAIAEQMGLSAPVDRLHLPARDGRPVRRHRRDEPHVRRGRVLRRRPPGARAVQRHGHRRGLDERRVVHRHGGDALPDGLRRARVRHGLDRRLLPGRAVPRAVPPQVRAVHDSRLPRRALRRPYSARGGDLRGDPVLVHLCRGADLRRGPDHDAPDRRGVRARHFPGSGRHPGVLVPGRDARGDMDAGRAVHHPDHRLHDPGGLAVGEADRHSDPADRLRQAAREGHGARGEVHQGSEGARGPRHLQGARRRGERESERAARLLRGGKGKARRRGREAQGRERVARAGSAGREGGWPRIRRTPTPRRPRGPRMRRSPRAPGRRCATPRRSPARTTPRATCRAGISSRSYSA